LKVPTSFRELNLGVPKIPYDVALSKGIKPKIKVQEERGHKGPLEPLVVVVVGPEH